MDESSPTSEGPDLDGELVASKARTAYLMQMAGHSLHDVALRLDYGSEAAVSKAIADELDRAAKGVPSADRHALLALQNDRYNYLLTKVWQSVEFGDLRAIDQALKIMASINKVNQLELPDVSSQTTQVLVIGGQENEYIDKLKRMIE